MLINHYLIYILIARLKADYNTIKISLNLEKHIKKRAADWSSRPPFAKGRGTQKNTCHMGRAGIRVGVASPVQDDSDKYINQYARCENKDTTV